MHDYSTRPHHKLASLSLQAWFLFAVLGDSGISRGDWPQWRGPLGTGVSPNSIPPTHWDEARNILWKTKIEGEGHGTPVVSRGLIFLTTSVPTGIPFAPRKSGRPGAHDNRTVTTKYQFQAWAIDASDGSLRWKKNLNEAIPLEGAHNTASLASASPITDGKCFYAFFGSHGLYCLDRQGKLLWEKQLGTMHTKHGHGEGASPALHGDTLVVNWDHEGDSFLVALDTTNGNEKWRVARNELTSWSSPIITTVDGEQQVIVCGTDKVRGYQLSSGDVVWECGGMSANIVATPVAGNGVLYVGSSYEKRVLMAIKLSGSKGDITGTDRILWTRSRGTPYVPSPLLYRGGLYFLTHYQNILTRVTAETGIDAPGALRLGPLSNIYASPVAANGHVYITDLEGLTLVITDTEIPRVISVNPIGEPVSASLVIDKSMILIRGSTHLHCVSAP
ncbi:MAG: PQQ-binding-like beta-propeller repeat protein [Rubripirellula sp.]